MNLWHQINSLSAFLLGIIFVLAFVIGVLVNQLYATRIICGL